ncbi:mechanosensitive ion channel family protein [Deinococcus hohokamensis]|uniref:Mechanosensitive ion channel family protein n=1 Tax=Deinococcus hohokamensis TaxID=309883 RepID=A0ABV9IBS9_9DEIO
MILDFGAIWLRLHHLLQGFVVSIPNVLIGLLIFGLFMVLAQLTRDAVIRLARRADHPPGNEVVFGRLASWVVLALGALVAFTVVFPTLTAASLFSALGVSGIAIGFAFKDIFQNLLAGLLLLITRPFRIGDQIVSGDHEGTVEDIQVRATLLRTYDNRLIVIPNSELYTNRVVVNTAMDKRRLSVHLGIGYGQDVAQAKAVIVEGLRGLEEILQDPPPRVLATDLDDYSVRLEVRFWINPPIRKEAVEAQDAVLEMLTRVLPEAGVDLPYPIQQVLLTNMPDTPPGSTQAADP